MTVLDEALLRHVFAVEQADAEQREPEMRVNPNGNSQKSLLS
jgi:hypothetical protein